MSRLTNRFLFRTIVLLLTLAFVLGMVSFTSFVIRPVKSDSNRTFLDWCLHSNSKTEKASVTVVQIFNVLYQEMRNGNSSETVELSCEQADIMLRQKKQLDLNGNTYLGNRFNDIEDRTTLFITDLRPLQSLIHLTEIDLSVQLIADLKPLRSLPKLTRLVLSSNKIVDVSPLASLKQLRYLDLQDNQITKVSSLRALTRLKTLKLEGNAIKQKVCPVKPSRICHF